MTDQKPLSGDVNISNISESHIDVGPIITGQVGGGLISGLSTGQIVGLFGGLFFGLLVH